MTSATLLVEIFTEELPPKSLKRLGDAFAQGVAHALDSRSLLAPGYEISTYATPRRLAVKITRVWPVAPDQPNNEKLMPVAVGVDKNGNATPALLKKLGARSLGHIPLAQLQRESDGKVDQLVYRDIAKGQTLLVALQAALEEAIARLPVSKVMNYQLADGATTVQFVRPAHELVALYGAEVIPVHALGLQAGRTTHGHRFQGVAEVVLNHADEYETRLENEGGVIASFEKRRDEINRLLFVHAEQTGDTLGDPEGYAALLDEVTALVERPTVYVGKFDVEFLQVPTECLVLTMKFNQKYFPLFLSEGGLSSRFLIVSNMRLDDPRTVIEGNERVIRPRLADARFFFETDKKTKLADRIPGLAGVVYHNRLGTQGKRVERVCVLAAHIAAAIGADVEQAKRAAYLAKGDLLTDMVGEFPELQGTMGRYYALHDGESPIVADAVAQHYQPRFAGDRLADSPVALSVALADKMETLAGMFCIGQQPSGDKDPFALRRHALGVARMLVEKKLPINVFDLIGRACALVPDDAIVSGPDGVAAQRGFQQSVILEFIHDRLKGYLRELAYSTLEIESILSKKPGILGEVPALLDAVREFQKLPEAASLAVANKRIGNILKKAEKRFTNADVKAFVEPAERALFDALQAARPVFDKCYTANDFAGALQALAPLKTPVDAFFDRVMVNAEDAALRENRMALLSDLHVLMNKVADLSKLAA